MAMRHAVYIVPHINIALPKLHPAVSTACVMVNVFLDSFSRQPSRPLPPVHAAALPLAHYRNQIYAASKPIPYLPPASQARTL